MSERVKKKTNSTALKYMITCHHLIQTGKKLEPHCYQKTNYPTARLLFIDDIITARCARFRSKDETLKPGSAAYRVVVTYNQSGL